MGEGADVLFFFSCAVSCVCAVFLKFLSNKINDEKAVTLKTLRLKMMFALALHSVTYSSTVDVSMMTVK